MDILERSNIPITGAHLAALRDIALDDKQEFFNRKTDYRRAYDGRLLAIALCQGAALHYVDGKNGVKDFDVWSFYMAPVDTEWRRLSWERRLKSVESGLDEFGVHPDDLCRGYKTRRVDLLARTFPEQLVTRFKPGIIPILQAYVRAGKVKSSPWYLAKKAVVGLWPDEILGKTIWPSEVDA